MSSSGFFGPRLRRLAVAWLACVALAEGGDRQPPRLALGERQLFVDDFWIERRSGLEREFQSPRLLSSAPVFKGAFRGFVYPEPGGGYRLYYSAGPNRVADDQFFAVRMAGSRDGVHWEGSDLDLIDVDPEFEEEHNNVLVQDAILMGLFIEPAAASSAERWKAVILDIGRTPTGTKGHTSAFPTGAARTTFGTEALFTSADGIHWTHATDTDWPPQSITRSCHEATIAWVPGIARYVRYACRTATGETGACVLERRESADLIHWGAASALIFAGLPGKSAAYRLSPFLYQGGWLGWVDIVGSDSGSAVRLATSRDGGAWTILPVDVALPFSSRSCRTGLTVLHSTGGPVPVGDELWLYGVRPPRVEPGTARDYGTELFVLRRDGFAALAGGASPGLLVTRPFVVPTGGGLYVNAEVEPGGSIRASVLGPDSHELVGFEQSRCAELTATSIRAPLRWSGAAGLSALAARPVRLAFHIKNAKLYSFWIE